MESRQLRTEQARQIAGVPDGGRFVAQPRAEGGSLEDAAEPTVDRFAVRSTAEMKKALAAIKRGKPARAVIDVSCPKAFSLENFPVIHPPAGTVLNINVRSGIPDVTVAGGRVVVSSNSGWGNVVNATGGQVHIRTDGGDRKVTVHIEPADPAHPPVVTTSIGEQSPGHRMYIRDSDSLPELETSRDAAGDIPTSWLADESIDAG